MKNIILTTCLLWMTGFTQAQIYQPFENASRQVLTDSCFGHPGTSLTTSNAINGKSMRTGQLTSMTMNHGVIFPFLYLDGDDTLTFLHRTSSTSGFYYLTVYTLDVNNNIIDTLLNFSYNKSSSIFSESIHVQDSGIRKIQFAFNGNGGNGRGVLDDVFISAEWAVDFYTCSVNQDAIPLPVSLLSMKAEALDNGNLISWSTALELNNAGFELYRATNDGAFEQIAWIEGHGNSNSILKYQYLDEANLPESKYYLKQIDFDGKSETFPVIFVQNNQFTDLEVTVFPNPAKDKIYIRQSSYKTTNTITISDLSGRVLKDFTLEGSQLQKIELVDLLKGWYIVTVYSAEQGKMHQTKLCIQ